MFGFEIDPAIVFICIGMLLLLAWSAFFSGSETALMASSRPKLHALEHEGNKPARRVNSIVADPETLLGTILLGNNLVNIGASSLMTGVMIKLIGDAGMIWATLMMTVLVLIFSEVLPKTFAASRPEQVAMWVSLPMKALIKLLYPFTWAIRKISRSCMRLVGVDPDKTSGFGVDDVRGAISLGLMYGILERGEHRMLDSILDLNHLTVEDVMIHRSGIESLDVTKTIEEMFQQVAASAHSRIPVWEGNSDNIIGILHAKDFYRAYSRMHRKGRDLTIRDIMGQPYYVPATVNIHDQLREFRRQKRHMAMVVDEYGDLLGLVTLEDVLEEIVGEIEDEHDRSNPDFVKEPNGSVTIQGDCAVRDLNRAFNWGLPENEAVTLGGLLIEKTGHIPLVGEKVRIGDVSFRVLAKRRQAVVKVRARVMEPSAHQAHHDDKKRQKKVAS